MAAQLSWKGFRLKRNSGIVSVQQRIQKGGDALRMFARLWTKFQVLSLAFLLRSNSRNNFQFFTHGHGVKFTVRNLIVNVFNPQFINPGDFIIRGPHRRLLRFLGSISSMAMLLQFGQAFSSRSTGVAWSLIFRSLSSWASPLQPHDRHSIRSVESIWSSYHI